MLIGIAVVTSCDQSLESGVACPALCPTELQQVRDTSFYAIAFDTALPGYPSIGTEPRLLVAHLGSTYDARAVFRFDSLVTHYFASSGGDSVIRSVDSARVVFRLAVFDTLDTNAVTFSAYDVDAAGDDTAAATLVPAFTSGNLLGDTTFRFADTAFRADSVVAIPIDAARLLAKLTADSATGAPRLRVGIRISGDSSVQAQILTTNGSTALGPQLSYVPADTGAPRLVISPASTTPSDDQQLRVDLEDFQIVAAAPPAPGPDVVRVGGVPGWRTYYRFEIPRGIVDSSSIIRALLILHQHPNPALPESSDSLYIAPYAVTASSVITDISRLLTFITLGGDSVQLVPNRAAVDSVEIINIVRPWRGTDTLRTPRQLVMSSTLEGARAWAVEFYSNEAADSLRPRLQLFYLPQPRGGLP